MSHIDVSSFASKINLASLKAEVDKLDIPKLIPIPQDLAKLSNVIKNDVVKKTEYHNLANKVNNINTTGFVSKITCTSDIGKINNILKTGSDVASKDDWENLKAKISKVDNFLFLLDFHNKVTELENKIPNVANLGTKSLLSAIENKIPDINGFVKKTDYSTEITKIKNDYVTTSALNAVHKDLIQKTYFDSELKKVDDKAN